MNDVMIGSSDIQPKKRIETLKESDYVKLRNDVVSKAGVKAKKGEIGRIFCITGRHSYFSLEVGTDRRVIEVHSSVIELLPEDESKE